jgi:anthranilate phosphoribosyltransferase
MSELLSHYQQEFAESRDVQPSDSAALFDAINAERNETILVSLLRAWNRKGIAEEELFEFAVVMRRRMKRIQTRHTNFIDMVGTGGSSAKSFNVSTAAAFVVAGAGVPVAKHGNRAATSNSGSADVLAQLGIEVDIDPEHAQRHLDEFGLCFMFAPRFHSLSPVLARARRSLGEATIFNNLGPLCNPASAPHHVIGVAKDAVFEVTARVLARLGTGRSWVVRGDEGLDEISITGKTHIADVNGGVTRTEITPGDFGIAPADGTLPQNCSADESARLIRGVLAGNLRDENAETLVLINAAAAIHVAGACSDLKTAFQMAKESIRSGAAMRKLEVIVAEASK